MTTQSIHQSLVHHAQSLTNNKIAVFSAKLLRQIESIDGVINAFPSIDGDGQPNDDFGAFLLKGPNLFQDCLQVGALDRGGDNGLIDQ